MKASASIPQDDFAVLVGIDWADKKHDVCELDLQTGEFSSLVVPHTPEAIDEWVMGLQQRYPGKSIAIACELSRGPLINALQAYEHVIIYPLNPGMVAKYRQAFANSGSKNDPLDARLQVEILHLHRHKLKPLTPQSSLVRQLSQLVHFRRKMVQDRVKLTNKLTVVLKQYYPQALEWFGEKDTVIFCDFLIRWPTLHQLKKARKSTLLAFYSQHHSRYPEVNQQRVENIKAARPLTSDTAVIKPHSLMVSLLAPQLKHMLMAIDELDEEIKRLYRQHDDRTLFDSLPGAGPCYAPRLLVAFGDDRARYPTASDLQKYAGIAPVIEASGQKSWTHWRYFCSTFLRQSFVEWAGQSVRYSYWAKAYYNQQITRGKHHNAAIRSLAFKWIRIVWRCWQDRKPYDVPI